MARKYTRSSIKDSEVFGKALLVSAYRKAFISIAGFIEAYVLDAAGDSRYESLATLILKGVETAPAGLHDVDLYESLAKSLAKLILERKLLPAVQDRTQ